MIATTTELEELRGRLMTQDGELARLREHATELAGDEARIDNAQLLELDEICTPAMVAAAPILLGLRG